MIWFYSNALLILVALPLLGAIALSLIPSKMTHGLKLGALTITVLEALLSLLLLPKFINTGVPDQFTIDIPWIKFYNIRLLLAVDGVSFLLILLSTLLIPLTLIGTWNSIEKNIKGYLIAILTLLSGMVGVFCALDIFLFYVFWEVMLIPMYFLIGIWGGENRHYATTKFFLYTMAGSVVMLVAFAYLRMEGGGSFSWYELANHSYSFTEQKWIFVALALAFAIKVPLFPFHTWLPDAHVQAPTAGSVILAGVLLKMGTYGFFRFVMPFCPEVLVIYQPYLMGIAVCGVIFGALVALVQTDIKKLIAYSSVSHMGVVMLGLFSLQQSGLTGGLYQMFNHAVSTGGLFLLIGMLYDRTHTRQIKDYSGLAKFMPVYTVFFLIVTFSSIAVPLTNGFVGEFLALVGSFKANSTLTLLATPGLVLGAGYMLWLVERVFFGEPKALHGVKKDLVKREVLLMSVFALAIVVMGVYPKPFLKWLERPAETVLLELKTQTFNK